jgi:hypothetical protein
VYQINVSADRRTHEPCVPTGVVCCFVAREAFECALVELDLLVELVGRENGVCGKRPRHDEAFVAVIRMVGRGGIRS